MTNNTLTMEDRKSKKSKSEKDPETDKWEYETIGKFLLKLFHEQFFSIRDEFLVTKSGLRNKFNEFLQLSDNKHLKKKFEESYGMINIGRILHQTDFIIDTPRGADYFRIKNITLFRYRNEKLKEWDDKRINHSNIILPSSAQMQFQIETISADDTIANFKFDPALLDFFKVADNAKFHPLTYEGSKIENKNSDFILSNMGCFICQCNFETAESFEDHIEWHTDDSDFESLKELKKLNGAYFDISYAVCKNSHYFCFSLNTKERNIIIEKIIIVRSNSFYNVNKNEYEWDEATCKQFYVDSHLFTKFVIQPVVIVFRYKSSEAVRVVEQHHFWRSEEFPQLNFSIKSNRLPSKTTFRQSFELPQYMPPHEIKVALRNEFACESLCDISNELRQYVNDGQNFSISNICKVLNTLLQIEDMDGIKKYEALVQHDAQLSCFDNQYTVKLKNRGRNMVESVLTPYDEVIIIVNKDLMSNNINDKDLNLDMILRNKCDFNEKPKEKKPNIYFGVVENVSSDRVTFICDKKISEIGVHKLIFRPARLTLRYQYRAIEYLDKMAAPEKIRIFFPVSGSSEATPNSNLELFNSSIENNPEQYQAVRNIAAGPTKNATYIIFGPPGTGKTTTIVEAVLQLYKWRKNTKILITAGSNSACDEVALRLCKALEAFDDNRAIVRIFAKSNEKRLDNIDEILIEASNMYGAHFYPHIPLLHEYRIVCCTLSVIGRLSTGKFGRFDGKGVYTHIFVDEVAASTQAETLVGLSSIISPLAHVIISGDHKQLGPVLQSDQARDLGLDVSLMERLLKRDCYKVDEYGNYDHTIQTRLRRNYRSHPEIVNLYNELYYNAELIPMAKEENVNLAKTWHSSPNPNFPIIFHNVFGNCAYDKGSTSLFNGKELEVVMDYVKDLMCYGINGKKIEQKDIGIISPYKKQYLRIQDALNLRHLYSIETGSVETFQGKEKDIIIVSFVRSFTSSLGFLESPRRLNVTLSRAKSLLILIGNPKTLGLNDDFKRIIEKCRENKTMVGTSIISDLSNAPPKKSNGNQRRRNNNNMSSNKKDHINNDKQNNVKQLGRQMKKGKTSQRQQNQEKTFKSTTKKQVDIDLLLQSLPDVPTTNTSKTTADIPFIRATQPNGNISYASSGETVKQSFRAAASNAKSSISIGGSASVASKQFTSESRSNVKTPTPIKTSTYTNAKTPLMFGTGITPTSKQISSENHANARTPITIERATSTGTTRENHSYLNTPVSLGGVNSTGTGYAPRPQVQSNVRTPITIARATATTTTAASTRPMQENYPYPGNGYAPRPQVQSNVRTPITIARATATATTAASTRPMQENYSNVHTPVSPGGVNATTTRYSATAQINSNINAMIDRTSRLSLAEQQKRERDMQESLYKIRAKRLAEEEARQKKLAEEAKRNNRKKDSTCLIS